MKKFKVEWNEDTIEHWESILRANSIEDVQVRVDDGDHFENADMKESTATEVHAPTIIEIKEK